MSSGRQLARNDRLLALALVLCPYIKVVDVNDFGKFCACVSLLLDPENVSTCLEA
jgi:hypothetical protein